VRLVYFTLNEYRSARPGIFSRPDLTIAESCLTYLNSENVKAPPADPPSHPHHPSPKYRPVHWRVHAKGELLDHAGSPAVEMFRR